MARKDDILNGFLEHELLTSKYELKKEKIPSTVREALNSDISIVKVMALVVDGLESTSPITDLALRNQINQYLNT